MITKLKYGNTNTYFIKGLLIDTDYAGTLSAFYKAIKKNGIEAADIKYILATHYHPDHMGLVSELTELGIKLLLMEHQTQYVHYSDKIFYREPRLKYKPIEFIYAYERNQALRDDWKLILSYDPVTIHYGHANENNNIRGRNVLI